MTNRTFFKTRITVEVLSEEPIPPGTTIAAIADEAINGGYSMITVSEVESKLDGKKTAKALLRHGSDPEFFRIDENGEDVA
jgi:hypothetical protein